MHQLKQQNTQKISNTNTPNNTNNNKKLKETDKKEKSSSIKNEKDKEQNDLQFQIKIGSLIQNKSYSFQEDYKLGGVLGLGAFSTVRKVTHRKTKSIRAMKIINKQSLTSEEDKNKFVNEIEILRQIDHPHILKLYEFYQDENNYYIIVEMATGGELFQKIIEYEKFQESEAAYVMQQILSAVLYAHNNNIVHRDLKPENILLDITSQGTYYIKVVDWGTSKKFENGQQMTEKFGTPYYIAPDVLKKNYNEKCDIWSCGVILYILLSGRPPFTGSNEQEIMNNILKGGYTLEGDIWETISVEAKDLIKKMLEYKVDQRLSAVQCFEHDWFKLMNIKERQQINVEQFNNNMTNLKSFRAESKLQQATLSFIATQLTSKEEKYQLTEAFKKIDQNGDGVLSRQEIYEGFLTCFNMSHKEAEREVNTIFNTVDIDKSGQIDYHEFIVATMNRKKALSKDKIAQSFALFDKDGDGYITAKELKQVLGGHVSKNDDQAFKIMVNETDINGDGQISLEEFTALMEKYVNY